MHWLALVGIFATGLVAAAHRRVTGTCASISYSTTCCPPDANCQATDGNCYCNAECHEYEDCCADVQCPEYPRMCTDIGITTCCVDSTNTGRCDVDFRDSQKNHCSCDVSCHLRNDCCEDAVAIGCVPETCTEAGKSPGCCTWSASNSCYVSGGDCYCDMQCSTFNDCCDDVETDSCSYNDVSRSKALSTLEQEFRTSTIRKFNEKDRKTQRIQYSNAKPTYHRKLPAARTHRRHRPNAREFRARVQRTVIDP